MAERAELAVDGALLIHAAFTRYMAEFGSITQRSRVRFEQRDWPARRADALQRLNLYNDTLVGLVDDIHSRLGRFSGDREMWSRIRDTYAGFEGRERNFELARTFYNSVTRRVFRTTGVNPDIEFASLHTDSTESDVDRRIFRRYEAVGYTPNLVRTILEDRHFEAEYRNIEVDATQTALRVESRLEQIVGYRRIDAIEVLHPVFYRSKGAYIVGRIVSGERTIPLILALLSSPDGIFVDAVLLREDEVSVLFSFTRSYFHVESECPRELIAFLRSIIPVKPVEDLYNALGFNKHGKTELYRSLQRHLEGSSDLFRIAAGDRGMVMLVFTLDSYDRVFKIIRDSFAPPKTTTPRDVMNRYRLVFEMDRVGRLVEAQKFRHLKIRIDRFDEELLRELVEEASRMVTREGDFLIIDHVYAERKVRPLNLYLREAQPDAARAAVLDYGAAIRELAAANIFPGDLLLKNFGVTRHGRVVFYDYDELCLLTDCNFRRLPTPRTPEDELASEPWFAVADNDVFPEEFSRFLGLGLPLLDVLVEQHGDLFTAAFWQDLKEQHAADAYLNFYPYPTSERLPRAD